MKKILLTLLVLLVALSAIFTGCSSKEEVDNSWNDIKEAGKIIVGLDDEFPPMGYRDENNEITGFDVEMAYAAAEKLGVEIEFKPIDWDSKVMELNNKNIDVIWNGLSITPDRQEKMLFTNPYMENRQVIIVMKDSSIKTKADLKEKVIGLQADSSSLDALKKDEATFDSIKEVVQYNNNNEALMDLPTGRIDAVVVDEIVGRFYIGIKKQEFKVLDESFGSEEYGVGLRKEDAALLLQLQKALDEMKEDGTAKDISIKWFGENIVK